MIIRKLKGIYLPHETSESVLKVPHQKTFFSAPTTTVTVMPEPGGAGGGTVGRFPNFAQVFNFLIYECFTLTEFLMLCFCSKKVG